MAAPHVAGTVALYLQTHPAATPRQVHDALYAVLTKGVVLGAHSANNHLAFAGP
jgi:subtilisin family serine protease